MRYRYYCKKPCPCTPVAQTSPFRFGGVVNPPKCFTAGAPILENIDKFVNRFNCWEISDILQYEFVGILLFPVK